VRRLTSERDGWKLGGIVLVVIAPLNYDLPNDMMKVTCDKAADLLKCFGTSGVAPRLCTQRHPPGRSQSPPRRDAPL
jgi:hypothetical protein